MTIVKCIKINKDKVPDDYLGLSVFKRRLLNIAKRYNAKGIEFFEQDGTNFRDNKVTICFYDEQRQSFVNSIFLN